MKNFIFPALLSFFISTTYAQITINSTDFISSEDTVMVSVVTDYQNINYQNTGPNHNWDFSWVMVDSQRIDTFYNVSSAGIIYQLVFNNFLNPDYQASYFQKAGASVLPSGGGLPVSIENPIVFEKVSNTKFERVGLGIELNGIDVPISADTIDVVYEFPMTYQDSWVSNSYLFFDLNPAFNAMFKRYQNRVSAVDGYGTLTTPFGTFDCIRVKSSLNYNDSLFIDLLGTGGSWIGVPSQPEIQYRWIAKNQKIPVLTIDVVNALTGPEITKVEFRDDLDVTGISDDYVNELLSVYPNPANNSFNISVNSTFDNMEIIDVQGRQVYFSKIESESIKTVDCRYWEKGIYILLMKSKEKIITKKIVIE